MSARAASARKISCPRPSFRLRTIPRLLRLMLQKPGLSVPRLPAIVRVVSPSGGSTLTTSAPRSPRSIVQNGPAITWVASRTRTPSRACFTTASTARARPAPAPALGRVGGDHAVHELGRQAQRVAILERGGQPTRGEPLPYLGVGGHRPAKGHPVGERVARDLEHEGVGAVPADLLRESHH